MLVRTNHYRGARDVGKAEADDEVRVTGSGLS